MRKCLFCRNLLFHMRAHSYAFVCFALCQNACCQLFIYFKWPTLSTELETKRETATTSKKCTKQMDFRLKWAHKVVFSYFLNFNNLIWRLKSANVARRANKLRKLTRPTTSTMAFFPIEHWKSSESRIIICDRASTTTYSRDDKFLSLSRWASVGAEDLWLMRDASWRATNTVGEIEMYFSLLHFYLCSVKNVADRHDGRPRAIQLCHGQPILCEIDIAT